MFLNLSRRTMASTGNKEKRAKVIRKTKNRQSGDSVNSISSNASQHKMRETSSRSSDRSRSSVPLLDMLAEVASATLRSDPSLTDETKETKYSQKAMIKVSSRKSYCSEHLSLDQIRVLSDKMLLEMFSELVSDEIRKNYSYQCFLMPEKCKERFSSFGSETKARLQMKAHLLTHIAELLAEANAPGKSHRIKFIAEPLHVRKKRLLEGNSKKKPQLKQPERNLKRRVPTFHKEKESVEANDVGKNCLVENGKTKHNNAIISTKRDHYASKWKKRNRRNLEQKEYNKSYDVGVSSKISDTKNLRPRKIDTRHNKTYTKLKRKSSSNKRTVNDKLHSHANNKTNCVTILRNNRSCNRENISRTDSDQENHIDKCHNSAEYGQKHTRSSVIRSTTEDIPHCNEIVESNSDDNCKTKVHQEKSGNCFKENVKTYQIDTLDQPQHDHCYTTVLGKRRGIGTFHLEYSSSSEEESGNNDLDMTEGNKDAPSPHLAISTPCFPFVFTPLLPNISQIVEISSVDPEAENAMKQMAKSGSSQVNFGNNVTSLAAMQKPKQTRIRRVNRIIIAEELKSDSEEESVNTASFASGKIPVVSVGNPITKSESSDSLTDSRRKTEGTPEWEKKLALKCIRALRYKKKEERGPLQCKICKDKKFTAQATLMYHYRSHAGIKPFTCGVCGSTFTRQHSLNYHMLIHNNKSRFVCNDCGRNFRHPSHYKEHLRRHTGETPYECSDCSLRFKTRNTFKRHLKTRHGKILTAQGIATLTAEEFHKVRTLPRKKLLQKCVPIKKKDKETQWPEINMLNDECMIERM